MQLKQEHEERCNGHGVFAGSTGKRSESPGHH